jgi:hypothetical protein
MNEIKKSRKRNAFDRIVLTPETQAILAKLISEVSDTTNGLLNLHGRDVANFLIQARCHSFDSSELACLRTRYFDDVKAAKWMVNQIREARSNGDSVDLEELFKKVRMQSVETKPSAKKASRPRKPKTQDAPQSESEVSLSTMSVDPKAISSSN